MEAISNPSTENLNLLGRLDLRSSLTKLNLWRQIQYDKVVFLDADTVVLQNLDHLFDLDVQFAAAPDIGWPDIFNSGVFFARPNIGTYAALRRLADAGISFDGGDQGLLNSFFPSFTRLSFTYNVTPSAGYQYLPAYRHFQSQVKVAHFIGAEKPWSRGQDIASSQRGPYAELLAHWWAVYLRHYSSSSTHTSIPKIRNRAQFSPPRSVMATIDEEGRLAAQSSGSPVPFEASQTAWDAQRTSPPPAGRPEAANLQYMSYANNWDSSASGDVFVPPSTPKIPKSVHFEPPSAPDPSKQIFPWEGRTEAQRAFPEDAIAPLQEIIEIERNPTPQSDQEEQDSSQAFANYQFSNAWDSVQRIKDYVAKMPNSTTRPRAPSSTWGSGSNTPREAEWPEGPAGSGSMAMRIPGSQQNVTTDFLLQEPAGLPKPQDWNPSAQLEQLASKAVSLARESAGREAQPPSSRNTGRGE